VATTDRFVPKKHKGYIVALHDPEEEKDFVEVLFLGYLGTVRLSPDDINYN
jgi:hypothetical protein